MLFNFIQNLRVTFKEREKRMIMLFHKLFFAYPNMVAIVLAFACVAVCLCHVMKSPNHTLKLFQSQSAIAGGLANTLFLTTPTEITEANAEEFFRYDHTPILFKGGYCLGTNYECATCIVFDIDNSNSDTPVDWILPDKVASRLKELGINFWISTSRNHQLAKEGKIPRPKFHVYLMLSTPLYDSDEYVLRCEWCIKTFGSDPKVKSKAQKIFGYGNNPNVFIDFWSEGRCIDEVLTNDDLIASTPSQKVIDSLPFPSDEGSTAFDWFSESGEWKNHLVDLESRGWRFDKRRDRVCFQTPDGDHASGKNDGNIKGGVAYFFSKTPAPFQVNKGYSISQLFAGVLFGDTGKKGLAKFATKYLQGKEQLQDVPEKVGIEILDRFLENVTKTEFTNSESEKVKISTYYVKGIDDLLKTVKKYGLDIGMKNEMPHVYNGNYWQRIEMKRFQKFLQTVGKIQGIPYGIIKDHKFVDNLIKQFICEAHFLGVIARDTPKMNLRNGTLHFTTAGAELRPFDKLDGLTYQLCYDYDPSATAPMFQNFLDVVQPDISMQKLFFQYIGYVFLRNMNLEKILFLYGGGANGKSVLLNIIRAFIGNEQCCAYSLEELTKISSTRAELGKHLFNICTEISRHMGVALFKKIASREPISVNPKHRAPYNLDDYATSIFSTNELPRDVEQTGAFFDTVPSW